MSEYYLVDGDRITGTVRKKIPFEEASIKELESALKLDELFGNENGIKILKKRINELKEED